MNCALRMLDLHETCVSEVKHELLLDFFGASLACSFSHSEHACSQCDGNATNKACHTALCTSPWFRRSWLMDKHCNNLVLGFLRDTSSALLSPLRE